MTFEHWWASLTNAERRILTENYARYIWSTAQAAAKPKPEPIKLERKPRDERQLELF